MRKLCNNIALTSEPSNNAQKLALMLLLILKGSYLQKISWLVRWENCKVARKIFKVCNFVEEDNLLSSKIYVTMQLADVSFDSLKWFILIIYLSQICGVKCKIAPLPYINPRMWKIEQFQNTEIHNHTFKSCELAVCSWENLFPTELVLTNIKLRAIYCRCSEQRRSIRCTKLRSFRRCLELLRGKYLLFSVSSKVGTRARP